ncbi:tyrosine-protein phosphatase non-receptor type 2-like isoform X2 [Amphiura filiformis]|uniref:tyrosine-protein phosphatase non-receptor type 2-like isoform X2 n=1 Tax=Amphiura filiformis TaxID=82378 RepID=UPI003B215D25
MSTIQDEFKRIEEKKAWGAEFIKIRVASSEYEYTHRDAKKPQNKALNRYRDVSPYDHTRVKLQGGISDYINASLVQLPNVNRRYILTQGPLPHTISHFWQMVWEQNSKAVIMLNNVIEKGTVKCAQYFPKGEDSGGDDVLNCEESNLHVNLLKEEDFGYYLVRTLVVEDVKSGEAKEVLQFHYNRWSDFSVPKSPDAFLRFLHHIRKSGSLDDNVGPPVIHCSAGIGRSGTLCLVDTCLLMIEKQGSTDGVNVHQVLLEMRRCRMGLIQTPDQLRFSYLAIMEGAKAVLDGKGLESFHVEQVETIPENPPPLPPRQIKRPHSPDDEVEGHIKHPKEDDGSGDGETICQENSSTNDSSEQAELRRRKRQEKNKALADKVAEMKKKQRDSEDWNDKKSMYQYLGIGVGLCVGAFLLYRWFIGGGGGMEPSLAQ